MKEFEDEYTSLSDSGRYTPLSDSVGLVSVDSQKTVAFPDCAKRCAFVKAMGVGECESACPWKFDREGNPVADE